MSQPSLLTATTRTDDHWVGGPATVANLDAANLTAYEPIRGNQPTGLGLFINQLASFFPDGGLGFGGAPMVDAAAVSMPQSLTTSRG